MLEAPRTRFVARRRGRELIAQPLLNKGTAFTEEERTRSAWRAPAGARHPLASRWRGARTVRRKPDHLERYVGLAALQDRNEVLFYRVLAENLEELLPIVYTPTVGRACQEFSHILRRPRGIWITPADLGRIDEILRAASDDDIRLIVVTDNERILGLGDQGAGGMGIPIGKLALYIAAAGIHPAGRCPSASTWGPTARRPLLDPLYLGYAPRASAARPMTRCSRRSSTRSERRFPAVVQWEDFKQHNALRILDATATASPASTTTSRGPAPSRWRGCWPAGATGRPGRRACPVPGGRRRVHRHRRPAPPPARARGRTGPRRWAHRRPDGSGAASSTWSDPSWRTTSAPSRWTRAGSPRPALRRRS